MSNISYHLDAYVFVIALCLAAGLLYLLRNRAGWSLLLRLCVYAVFLWLILEPSWTQAPKSSGRPALSVLLDVSKSMGIEDSKERLAQAQEILKKSRDFLEDHFDVAYYQFGETSARSDYSALMKAKPRAGQSNISEAVAQVLQERRAEQASVLLLSDGTQNTTRSEGASVPAELPVYAVGLGNEKNISDIALIEARGSDFAFKGRPLEVSVTVKNYGFLDKTVPVVLKEIRTGGPVEIAAQELKFQESPGQSELVFKFIPQSVGRLRFRVEIPLQKSEMAKQNNSLGFEVEVGREKLRILYLCGGPSPEYNFLRQILKSDPNIDLVSFVILRNPENVVPVPEEQLSLIPFPTQDIFVRTLPEFDLLIFENFAYARFGILPEHLQNIRTFVEQRGGGFLMVGGENSFGRGGYMGTPIESILPVQMNTASENIEPGELNLKILDAAHPVMKLGDAQAESERNWKEMPPLNGLHMLPSLKSGASLLASVQGSGAPAIAVWQKGKGRVAAMSIFSTWQWALGLSERGLLQSNYSQFWRQMIRWLTSTEDSKPLRIILEESEWETGKKETVRILLQSDQKSLKDKEVSLSISADGKPLQSLTLIPVDSGEMRAEYVPSAEGTYQLNASARAGSRSISDKRSVEVKKKDQELENPYPDHAFLKRTAQASGGEYFDAQNFSAEALKGKVKKTENASAESVQVRLWTNPGFILAAMALLLLEWGIRRYRGGM